jgi:hypothetical protein
VGIKGEKWEEKRQENCQSTVLFAWLDAKKRRKARRNAKDYLVFASNAATGVLS